MTEGDSRRNVPSVDRVLKTPAVQGSLERFPRWVVLQETREVLSEARSGVRPQPRGESSEIWLSSLAEEVARRVVASARYSLRPVINATGVVLHTNLGRAPLGERALAHVNEIAAGYSNLELDLESGERGSRYSHVERLLCELCGAEAAMVVNNNAAAVLLGLSALAAGREVVISRGELVEIGGSFRIPEIMRQSGARLVEVGATNRCHLRDYAQAIGPETALLLKVHTSNFRMVGFTSEVDVETLAQLGREHGLGVMHDLGSGCLVDLRDYGLPPEPTLEAALRAGPDVVTCSGDKLLGGPQIGVIAGRRSRIDELRRHQLSRALRVDKLTLAAFEATLRTYRDLPDATREIPVLRMLKTPVEELRHRSEAFLERLTPRLPAEVRLTTRPGHSQAGAGSLPAVDLPTVLVVVTPPETRATAMEARLRRRDPPILVRLAAGEILVDLRTVSEGEEEELARGLAEAARV